MLKTTQKPLSRYQPHPSVIIDESSGEITIDVMSEGFVQIVITPDGDILLEGESILLRAPKVD
jgi:hypothetical protein